MKKLLVMTMVLVLGAPFVAISADTSARLVDQVVVDRRTRNKELNDYVFLTRDLIQRAWTTPVDIVVDGAMKGRIRINYVIKRSGALKTAKLLTGSGNAELDRTLLKAIRTASPFPPFPERLNARSLLVRANFIVADLPTMPVATAQHIIDRGVPPEVTAPAATEKQRKYVWGIPAGTGKSSQQSSTVAPEPPKTKRYRWGK